MDNRTLNRYIYNTILFMAVVNLIRISHVTAQAKSESHSSSNGIPFYIVAAIIGGMIIVTLTYVSLRKFNAERKKKNDKENS